MNLNRRTVLVGLGSIAAGGGALAGTGAFSSVEANRDVTVAVEGDANAYLALLPYDGPNGDGSQYVQTANGELAVTLDKVNKHAVTTLENVFEVLNQGSQPVALYIEDGSDEVSFTAEGASIEGESNAVNLDVGESTAISIEVDTTDGQSVGDVLLEEVTVVAEADDAPVARARNTLYVNDDGTGDFDNIQEAVSNASSGTTIQVASGTYSGFNVGSSAASGLSVVGAGGTTNTTLVDGGVVVGADATTVSGLRISNEVSTTAGTVRGIEVQSGVSDTTLTNNVVSGVTGPEAEQPKGIFVSDGVTGIRIAGNVVEDVNGVLKSGGLTDAVQGIQLYSRGGATISDVEIVNNTVRNVTGPRSAQGIQLVGDVSNVRVLSNEVTDLVGGDPNDGTGDWAQGIAIADGSAQTTPTEVTIRGNSLDVFSPSGSDDSLAGTAVVVEGETNVDEFTMHQNDLVSPNGVVVQNSTTSGTLDARENYWDSANGPTVFKGENGTLGTNTQDNTFNAGSQGSTAALGRDSPADIEFTPWLDAPADEGGDVFAPVEVNNPGSSTVSVPSFRAGIDTLVADGTMRVHGGSDAEFDEGSDSFSVQVSDATIRGFGTGRPTLLNSEVSGSNDYALQLSAPGVTVEGLRVFSDDTTTVPKEFRLLDDDISVVDCEVDRGHAIGAEPTGQSGIQVDGTKTGISVRNCDLSKAAIGLSGGSGHDVEATGNRIRDSHSEGIFAVVPADTGSYTIQDNDVKDYAQANSKAGFLFTDLPASLNGSGFATAEGYVDEILASNPEITEAKVTDGDGTDSRKTQ